MIESKEEFNKVLERLRTLNLDRKLNKSLVNKLEAFEEVEGLINLIIPVVSKSLNVFLVGDNVLFGHQKGKVVWTSVRYVDIKLISGKLHQGIPVALVKHP